MCKLHIGVTGHTFSYVTAEGVTKIVHMESPTDKDAKDLTTAFLGKTKSAKTQAVNRLAKRYGQ